MRIVRDLGVDHIVRLQAAMLQVIHAKVVHHTMQGIKYREDKIEKQAYQI